MWLMVIWIFALIIGVALSTNLMWLWKILFWFEMRCPKWVERK
jgi:hypothetical protein